MLLGLPLPRANSLVARARGGQLCGGSLLERQPLAGAAHDLRRNACKACGHAVNGALWTPRPQGLPSMQGNLLVPCSRARAAGVVA